MAPRGRPPKNKSKIPENKSEKKIKYIRAKKGPQWIFIDENNKEITPPIQKRKYSRRKNLFKNANDDLKHVNDHLYNHSNNKYNNNYHSNKYSDLAQNSTLETKIETESYEPRHGKQRRHNGRKRGRKSKNQDTLFKSEEVLDYVDRNYPDLGINRIRDKVINGLKVMRNMKNHPYLLYKFPYEGRTYYYDENDAIINTDGVLIGYFIKQRDGNKKMYMFEQRNKDQRTFEQIINDIESGKNKQKIESKSKL